MSYFTGQKDAEISLSPTIVMPLLMSNKKPYTIRKLFQPYKPKEETFLIHGELTYPRFLKILSSPIYCRYRQ